MPPETFPRDRFDDLPEGTGRVGAHRAENPRMRAGTVLIWAIAATVLLILVGILGSLVASGRVSLFPDTGSTPAATSAPEASPVVDTSFTVVIVNASGEDGLATVMKDEIVAAGWNPDTVLPSTAGEQFAETTIFYAFPSDEGAARGLAQVIGGAQVEQSTVYQPVDDPETGDVDEGQSLQLTVVIGTDRTSAETNDADPAP